MKISSENPGDLNLKESKMFEMLELEGIFRILYKLNSPKNNFSLDEC